MRTRLIRSCRFRAAHRYWRPEWSAEQNREVFGPCAEAPGHFHDYHCAVTVEGAFDPMTGMILDLTVLDRLLGEEITAPLEGQLINDALPAFAPGRTPPTCEALAAWFFDRLDSRMPDGVRVVAVRVDEDDTLGAECVVEP